MEWICGGFLLSAGIMIALAVRKLIVGKVKSRALFLLIIIPIYQVIMAACFFYVCREKENTGFFLGIILLFFSEIVNVFVLRAVDNVIAMHRLHSEVQELYTLRQQNRDIRFLGLQYEQERRRIQQECSQRLDSAFEMLERKEDFVAVRNTLEETCRLIRTKEQTVYCQHPIVNSVLVLKKRLASEKNIPMNIVTCVDKNIAVDPLDLCSLFCNLIDNAIEACVKISGEEKKREISILADCRSGFLSLRVENTSEQIPEFKNGVYRTSKSTDKQLHGLGLGLVSQIVETYDGRMEMKSSGNKIIVTVSIRTDADILTVTIHGQEGRS